MTLDNIELLRIECKIGWKLSFKDIVNEFANLKASREYFYVLYYFYHVTDRPL